MTEIPFDSLTAALPRPAPAKSLGQRLKIAVEPKPFVPPTLTTSEVSSATSLSAEAIFVAASAAVGKSTIASHLSATLQVPILDLSKVPVSTGSLKALLLDISGGPRSSLDAFHAGELPIIVDGLDEGRLLSGESGFESFLETTAEFLNENRKVVNRPKLVFFGRYESTDLAEIGLQQQGNITTSRLGVGFFGEEAAWNLIRAYADAAAAPGAPYRQHPEPVRKLIQAYFDAIEAALGLDSGKLWQAEQGRAFAGYAPVLAAVGSLLSQMDNFVEVTNRLKAAGAHEAWGVIETVLEEIIEREQAKLCDKLAPQISSPLPGEAYDLHEQMTLLSQYAHRQPLSGSGRVKLTSQDQTRYHSMINLYIPEHPFIRQQEFGNSVLGSVVIAHAIVRDLLGSADLERTANLSRQPFLWRSTSHQLDAGSLIDGQYLGYLLNSLWNDPVASEESVFARSKDDESSMIYVPSSDGKQIEFAAIFPLTLYAQAQNIDIDVSGMIKLIGHGPRGSGSVFYTRGRTAIICSTMEVAADTIRFDGEAWFEADEISSSPRLNIFLNGGRVGWGGQFAQRYPWNKHPSTLSAPYEEATDDTFVALIKECSRRFAPGGTLALHPDFTPADDDPHMRWVFRRFSQSFPQFVQLMIAHGLASSEPMPAAGRGKVRVRFDVAWGDLLGALERPEVASKWQAFIAEGRRRLGL